MSEVQKLNLSSKIWLMSWIN